LSWGGVWGVIYIVRQKKIMIIPVLLMAVAFILLPTAFAIILILIVWKILSVVRFKRANHQGSYLQQYKNINLLWAIILIFHIGLYALFYFLK